MEWSLTDYCLAVVLLILLYAIYKWKESGK